MKLQEAVHMLYDERKMPCCGATKFLEGPSGGASTNIECPNCGARWNTSLVYEPEMRVLEPINDIAKAVITEQ